MQNIKLEIEKMLRDKRKTQRLAIPLRVRYRVISGRNKKNPWQETMICDISGGGMRLQLDYPVEKGSRVDMRIYFPDDPKPVDAIAKSIWCRRKKANKKKISFDIGLQYAGLKEEDRERFIMLFCGMMVDYFVLSDREKQQVINKTEREQSHATAIK